MLAVQLVIQVHQHMLVKVVYYINGFHVTVSEQVVVLDKYTNSPSYRVVYQLQNHL